MGYILIPADYHAAVKSAAKHHQLSIGSPCMLQSIPMAAVVATVSRHGELEHVEGASFYKDTYSLVMLNVEQQGLVSHEIFLLQTLGKSSNAGELAETAAVSRLVAEGQIEEAGKLLRDFAHSHWSPASELLAATCSYHSFHKPRTPLHIQHAQGGAYWKEVRLLHYVFEHASRGCGASVCDAMDSFAETSWAATRQWSKIAGRLKAALLESSLRGTAAEVALLEMGTSLLAKFTVDCLVCL